MRLALASSLLLAMLACEPNRPGAVRIVNNYTGPCPLSVKTSEQRDTPPVLTPVAPGQTLLPEERAGLLRVDLQTAGPNCGPEPCTLGPAGFYSGCLVFAADGYPQKIRIENRTDNSGCVQPEVICPVGPDIDAAVMPVVPDPPMMATYGSWTVTMAEPTTGNGNVVTSSATLAAVPEPDKPTGIVVVEGTVGTVRHILKVEWTRATRKVLSVSHSWRDGDGAIVVVLCSDAPPWPACVGATVDPVGKRLRLVGTMLANPISGTERSTIDADLSFR